MNKLDTMRAFFVAVEANDKERIMSFFTEQSVFDNVPMGTAKGLEAIWGVFEPMHKLASAIEWQIERLEQSPGGTIFSERNDRFRLAGEGESAHWAEFRCSGIHEIDDAGKITFWRDYFDMQTCMATMAPKQESTAD